MKQPIERRLAAIVAADVAGYSRLMRAEEEGTLERFKSHRSELVDLKIREHRGRIVKTTSAMEFWQSFQASSRVCRKCAAALPIEPSEHHQPSHPECP